MNTNLLEPMRASNDLANLMQLRNAIGDDRPRHAARTDANPFIVVVLIIIIIISQR